MNSPSPPSPPRATYRVQLHAGFGFEDAAAVVPYLARLGVSHLYTSPILQAAPGSTHGYDVVDHSRLNAELGGEAGFERLLEALRSAGMGLVVDIVPNHMATGPDNAWWWDVLQHGPASRYAGHFDVDWAPPGGRLRNVILLPVLGDRYRRVLEAGDLVLVRDGGTFAIRLADQRFPLDPRSLETLLADAARRAGSDDLRLLARAHGELPASIATAPDQLERRQRDATALAERLSQLALETGVAEQLDAAVTATNRNRAAIDALLHAQNYRLAYWRTSSQVLGYRRFFDVDTLIGLRVERPDVFEDTHRLILDRVAAGEIQGLRIDHPDGLRDPAAYLARLRAAAPDAWIVAEKILEPGEPLRDWPIDGTTGYRFANQATGLQVDPRGEEPLTRLYGRLTQADTSWERVAAEARLQALTELLGSDLNRLTELWLSICRANPRYRDFGRHELYEALREVTAAFPVYRSYVRVEEGEPGDLDHSLISRAVASARDRRPDLEPELLSFLGSILRLEQRGALNDELAMRFQQLTPAAMAKGIEDTAFYRYLRFVALNEVGGDPGTWGISPTSFHAAMALEQGQWPAAMLSTSTHDTKRSGDVRARLALLAEIPGEWEQFIERIWRLLAPHRTAPELPGPAAEYLLLQTLVGAWPIDTARAAAYLEKATREAKERTSWTDPNPAFDDSLARLVDGALADEGLVAELERFVTRLAGPGRVASLAQTLWKLTAPGVPDIYQGTELWDLSLVDPDNRRAVHFGTRARLLDEAAGMSTPPAPADDREGLSKLMLIQRALALRARRAEAFGPFGAYRPLEAGGTGADHVVAFSRGDAVVSVGPRLPLGLAAAGGWRDAFLRLPEGRWRNVLDGGESGGGQVWLARLLADWPVALLERIE